MNSRLAHAIVVELIDGFYTDTVLTTEKVDRLATEYYPNYNGDTDAVMLEFEEGVWTDELEDRFSDIRNDGAGWYVKSN